MRISRLALCAALAASVGSGASHARVLEVKPDGTKEYSVLQDALSAAATGDTVWVYPGNYTHWTERWHNGYSWAAVGFIESGVTIIGNPFASTIRGPNTTRSVGLYSVTPDSFTVRRLRFLGDVSTGVVAAASTNHALVDSCLFEGTLVGIGVGAPASMAWIHRCEFRESEGVVVNAYAWAQIHDCVSNNSPGFSDYALLVANVGAAEMFDCTVNNGGVVQVNTGGSATVRDITATGVRTGALATDPGSALELDRISLMGLDSDLYVAAGVIVANDGTLTATDLSITNMWRAVQFESAGEVHLNHSHILNWDEWAVISLHSTIPPKLPLDLTGNWWGMTDSLAIAEAIWDGVDDPDANPYGIVDFWPAAPGPVPTREQTVGNLKAMYTPRRR